MIECMNKNINHSLVYIWWIFYEIRMFEWWLWLDGKKLTLTFSLWFTCDVYHILCVAHRRERKKKKTKSFSAKWLIAYLYPTSNWRQFSIDSLHLMHFWFLYTVIVICYCMSLFLVINAKGKTTRRTQTYSACRMKNKWTWTMPNVRRRKKNKTEPKYTHL